MPSPSEDYFQRLTAAATFDRALNIFNKRLGFFFLVSMIVFVPLVAVNITLDGYIGSSMRTFIHSMNNKHKNRFFPNDFMKQLIENTRTIATQAFIEMLVSFIFAIATEASIIYAVGQIYVNNNPLIKECVAKGCSKWFTLFCAGLLVMIGLRVGNVIILAILEIICDILLEQDFLARVIFFVGHLVWFIFMAYVFVSLIILSPAIVIENIGPVDAICRAWDLARNHRCYIFCTLFCFGFGCNLLYLTINGVVYLVAGKDAPLSPWGVFVAFLPAIVCLPLAFILKSIVYLNIRIQREGMNRGVLINNLEGMLCEEASTAINNVDRLLADKNYDLDYELRNEFS